MFWKQSKISRPTLVVIIATALFVAFFGLSSWYRQVNLITSQYDMGNMDQVLWQSLHGRWFQTADPSHPNLVYRTTFHADFLLLAYLPFYAIWADPRTLMIVQLLAVASGVIPLFWLARKKLGAPVGALLSVLYLFYPAQLWGMTFDVHAVVLAVPIFLWAWWAATKRNWWLYYPLIFFALLAKEEVGLVVAAMGFYWFWRPKYRTMGIISMVVGLSWTALMLGWAIPAARHHSGHFGLEYYAAYGSTFTEIIKNVLTHPGQVLADLFGYSGMTIHRQLLLPLGLLPLVGLPILILALPELIINLLSNNPSQHQIYFQYMSVIIPFVFLATIDGWARARSWLLRRPRWPLYKLLVVGVIGLAAISIYRWSPLPGTRHSYEAMRVFIASPYRADIAVVKQTLKSTDRVATTNALAPQFSRRDWIWSFPNDLDQADAVIVLEGGNFEVLPRLKISAAVQELRKNPDFTLVYNRGPFWYFRKKT